MGNPGVSLGWQNEVQPLRLGVHPTALCWHHRVNGREISGMGLWCQHLLIDSFSCKAAACGEQRAQPACPGTWEGLWLQQGVGWRKERAQAESALLSCVDTGRKDVAFSCRPVLTRAAGC